MPDKESPKGGKPAPAKKTSQGQNATLEQMGAADTQSEFSVSEARNDAAEEEQREKQLEQQHEQQSKPQQTTAADAKKLGAGLGPDDTQSEFSVEKRLRKEK